MPEAEKDIILCVENVLIKHDTMMCFQLNCEIISFSQRQKSEK